MKFFFLFSFFAVSHVAIAEDLAGPPAIFALESLENETVDDVLSFIPYGDVSLTEGVVSADVSTTTTGEVSKTLLEEKPYKAKLSFVNRRTNSFEVLAFNQNDTEKTFQKFQVVVAQCLKDYNNDYGNDIAFVEISDMEENMLFNGWVYKKRPSVNVFEHPVYSFALIGCE